MPAPNPAAAALIARLRLQPLPHEGGFFARTWTSRETLPSGRPLGTAIYFLLTPDDFSALHRLDADELWHFHGGDRVEHVQFPADPAHPVRINILGNDPTAEEIPQLLVPAGTCQGARLTSTAHHGWALVSCTMTPGWDENGFDLAHRSSFTALFPKNADLILALTRTT